MRSLKRFDIEEIIRINQGNIDATVDALYDLYDEHADDPRDIEELENQIENLEKENNYLYGETLELRDEIEDLGIILDDRDQEIKELKEMLKPENH